MSGLPLQRIEGKYEILEKMGEGGMGAIYRVRHRLLEEIRVIKVMRPQLVEDPELKARFLREARLAIQLRHPNVAQIYDFTIDDDGTAFIVMEFISGVTFEGLLRKSGPPSLELGLELARQGLKALAYLHAKGFVHRDISPDNLMLTEDPDGGPQVKLLDLGIAKVLDNQVGSRLTRAGSFLGKVRYSSPEQFGGEEAPAIDARSDLYSFAVVLTELLTGLYPIEGRDSASFIAGHLLRPPKSFDELDPGARIPPGLRELLEKNLAKDPAGRSASAAEMARALLPLRRPEEVDAAELARLLSPPAGAPVAVVQPVGSTQERLDLRFGLATTPAPRPPAEPTAVSPAHPGRPRAVPAAPPAEPAGGTEILAASPSPLALALAAVEERLDRGDYRAAEMLLYTAQAEHGVQAAFPPLHQRLARLSRQAHPPSPEELRQSALEAAAAGDFALAREQIRQAAEGAGADADLAARLEEAEEEIHRRATERRRAEQLEAALARLDGLLAAGDLDAAGVALDTAVLRVGAAPALRERWERLERLRREAKT